MIKKLIYALLVIVFLLLIAGFMGIRHFNNIWFGDKPNYLTYTFDTKPINFQWAEDTNDGVLEPHDAIVISSKLDTLPYKFYFQFDTGAPTTIIYEKTLQSLKEAGFNIPEVFKDGNRYLKRLDLEVGGSKIKASMLKVHESYGRPFSKDDTTNYIKLGTIGADFMSNIITQIDFKNQIIQLYQTRPEWMAKMDGFKPFDFKGRRFMLPTEIDGKKLALFYDSGCSAFGLITSKSRYDNYTAKNQAEIKYEGNRWGDKLTIHHKYSSEEMKIADAKLSLYRVSYVDMYAKYQKFMTPFTKIGGWLGNKPFLESTLILDTQKEEFAVITSN